MPPLGARPPVAGGIDLDVPGVDVRLRATRWPGAGVPVLLLHGLASTRRFWDLVVPGLAGLPVLALDQRGHGDSDRPDGPYDGATVVRDALLALDALGLSRAVVVGHSWGGWTALRLAAEAPERVLAVVAVDGGVGTPRRPGEDRAEVRERMTPPRRAVPPADLPGMLRRGPLGPWWSPGVEASVSALFAVGEDGLARPRLPFEAHMAIVDDLLDADPEGWLPQIVCPAWLVACSPDARRAEALARAAALLPRPRVQSWDGALHDVPLQWPALVAGLVRAAADEAAAGPGREGVPS
ncbi:MAG: alpha/beta hydrolase fold containing protein [Frankiales bacterium]|nr:alpha/beta hydrolase fold containing protein [Frankiales bacterium]